MTKLTDLVITKVALVDEGSCSEAHIKLYKRKEGGNSIMPYEEILKSLPDEQREVIETTMAKAKAELPEGAMSEEEKKKLELEKQAALDEVNSLKKSKPVENFDEEILKGVDPAVRALIEKSRAQAQAAEQAVLKMKEDQENTEILAKAKNLTVIPEADTKVTAFLKSIKGIAGAVDTAMDILKSANELIAKGTALKEVGVGGAAGSTSTADQAWANIEKAAAALVVKGTVSKEKAIDMVITTQPELYVAYLEAMKTEE